MAGPRPDDAYNPVQTTAPTAGMPSDYLTVKANPTQFGAQVGEAYKGLSKGLGQDESELFNTGMKYLELKNEMNASKLSNDLALGYTDLVTNFKQKYQGENAVDHLPELVDTMQQQLNQRAENLPLAAQNMYYRDARNYFNNSVTHLRDYVDTEGKRALIEGRQGVITTDRNQIVNNWNSQPAIDQGINKLISDTVDFQSNFLGVKEPDAIHAAVSDAVGDALYGATMKKAYQGNTVQEQKAAWQDASNFFQQYVNKTIPGTDTPYLSEKYSVELQRNLEFRMNSLNGRANKETVDGSVLSSMSSANDQYQTAAYGAANGNTPYLKNPNDGHYNVQQYVADLDKRSAGIKTADDMGKALIGTERSGPNAVSPKGALGVEQLTLDTFESEARLMGIEGQVDFNNATDRTRVFNHLVPRLWEKFQHDPEKVAVAYFSGEDNVNVGYKKGEQPYGAPAIVNQADWVDANKERIVQEETDKFKADNPDQPASAILDFQTKLYTQLTRSATLSRQQTHADENNIYSYISGNNPTGHPLMDPLVLENDPNINTIWTRFRQENGTKAWNILNKLITANSHGQAAGYGTQFWDNFSQVANGQVPNTLDLADHIGYDKNATLTNTGLSAMDPMAKRNETNIGRQFNQEEFKFLSSLRHFVTGTDSRPGVKDPINDEQWNKFLQVTLPKIEAGLQKGLTAHEMFDDPKSKTYVGDALDKFKPDTNKMIQHMVKTVLTPGQVLGAGGPKDFSTQSAYDAALNSKSITKEQAQTIWNKHPEWWPKK